MNIEKVRKIEEKIENERVVKGVRGFFSDFWAFASKGNIFDLAVGIMIGGAFSNIVNSLVTDIMTPFLSLGTSKVNLDDMHYTLRQAIVENGATTTSAVVVNYGHFLEVCENFVIIALSIFMFVKIIASLRERLARKEAAGEVAPPAPTTQEKLLGEIRDLLKDRAYRDEGSRPSA